MAEAGVAVKLPMGEAVLAMVVVMAGVPQTMIAGIVRPVAELVVTLAMEVVQLKHILMLVAAAVAAAVHGMETTAAVAAVSGF